MYICLSNSHMSRIHLKETKTRTSCLIHQSRDASSPHIQDIQEHQRFQRSDSLPELSEFSYCSSDEIRMN